MHKYRSHKTINLHLIGPKFSSYDYDSINYLGSMTRFDFSDYVSNLNYFTFGLIPLKNVNDKDDILPMKYFDYASCGLPSIATYNPLTDNRMVKNTFISYKLSDTVDFNKMLNYLFNISVNQMISLRLQSIKLARELDWNATLSNLKIKINHVSLSIKN